MSSNVLLQVVIYLLQQKWLMLDLNVGHHLPITLFNKRKDIQTNPPYQRHFACTHNTNNILLQLKHSSKDMLRTEHGFGF
jgi:hypothetical protein